MSASRVFRRAIGVLLTLSACTLPAHACINSFEAELKLHFERGNLAGVEKVLAELDARHAAARTLETGNDRAVARIMIGRHDDAIKLLRELETLNPGKAVVAANLGTALELSGNDVEALHWIREGIRRDPNEHHGTEWLHVLILEAKLEQARKRRWTEPTNLLAMDFGTDPRPRMPDTLPRDSDGNPLSVKAILAAIRYQTFEREKFVRPPDIIMAELFETAANLRYAAHFAAPEPEVYRGHPAREYRLAGAFAPAFRDRLQARLKQLEADFPGDGWSRQRRSN